MRPSHLFIIVLVAGIAAIGSGWHPLYIIFYTLLFSLLASLLLSLWSSSRLAFARTLPGGRAQIGDILDERLRLENRSWFPKLWVQVTDASTLPGHHAGYVASLGGRKRIDWRVRTVCTRRGRYYIGPVTATTGDPLGIFTRTIPLASQREFLVLPKALPIAGFHLLAGAIPGRGRGSQRSLQTTTNVVTVREYLPGDALSRIHWPSSVRQSRLMVKEFDLDPTIDVWLVLDLDKSAQAGEGNESTEEYGVTIAATLGQYFLRSDLSVGLIINDMQETRLGLDRGERQLDRLLEILAIVHADDNRPLSEALTVNELHFMRNSTLIVISPSQHADWVSGINQIRRRGVRTSVILLDAASFGTPSDTQQLYTSLATTGIAALTIQRGMDLVHALEVGTNA